MNIHRPIGVVSARASEILRRTASAAHGVEAKLAVARAADQCAVVGKRRALEKEKVVRHVQRAVDRQIAATLISILSDCVPAGNCHGITASGNTGAAPGGCATPAPRLRAGESRGAKVPRPHERDQEYWRCRPVTELMFLFHIGASNDQCGKGGPKTDIFRENSFASPGYSVRDCKLASESRF